MRPLATVLILALAAPAARADDRDDARTDAGRTVDENGMSGGATKSQLTVPITLSLEVWFPRARELASVGATGHPPPPAPRSNQRIVDRGGTGPGRMRIR